MFFYDIIVRYINKLCYNLLIPLIHFPNLFTICSFFLRCSDANLIDIPVEVETPDRHYYHV